jgi:hypothetical protein
MAFTNFYKCKHCGHEISGEHLDPGRLVVKVLVDPPAAIRAQCPDCGSMTAFDRVPNSRHWIPHPTSELRRPHGTVNLIEGPQGDQGHMELNETDMYPGDEQPSKEILFPELLDYGRTMHGQRQAGGFGWNLDEITADGPGQSISTGTAILQGDELKMVPKAVSVRKLLEEIGYGGADAGDIPAAKIYKLPAGEATKQPIVYGITPDIWRRLKRLDPATPVLIISGDPRLEPYSQKIIEWFGHDADQVFTNWQRQKAAQFGEMFEIGDIVQSKVEDPAGFLHVGDEGEVLKTDGESVMIRSDGGISIMDMSDLVRVAAEQVRLAESDHDQFWRDETEMWNESYDPNEINLYEDTTQHMGDLGAPEDSPGVMAPYTNDMDPAQFPHQEDDKQQHNMTMHASTHGFGWDPYVPGVEYGYDMLTPQHQREADINFFERAPQVRWMRADLPTAEAVRISSYYHSAIRKRWDDKDWGKARKLAERVLYGHVLTPILMSYSLDDHSGIWEGMHRLKAAEIAGLETIPCLIKIYEPPNGVTERQAARKDKDEKKTWVCVDLDGTLLTKYEGGGEFGKPIDGAAEAMQKMLDKGWRVSIFTTRAYFHEEIGDESWVAAVEDYLKECGIPYSDVITGVKPPAHAFIDDRAVHFDGIWNWKELEKKIEDVAKKPNPAYTETKEGIALIDTQEGEGGNDPAFDQNNDIVEMRHDLSIPRPHGDMEKMRYSQLVRQAQLDIEAGGDPMQILRDLSAKLPGLLKNVAVAIAAQKDPNAKAALEAFLKHLEMQIETGIVDLKNIPQTTKNVTKQFVPQVKNKTKIGVFDVEAYIKHVKGKGYCVYSHQTGKNFGCYKTKGEAKKRLQQMHKFSVRTAKHKEKAKRALVFHGLPVMIEFNPGDVKKGKDYEQVYKYPYGFIPFTKEEDGECIDVYLGRDYDALDVYVVDQLTKDGDYDEPKIMLGFSSEEDAESAYKESMPEWAYGGIAPMSLNEFEDYVMDSHAPIIASVQLQGTI